MITSIKILDGGYSGLEQKFPTDLEFDTNSGIVLIVGPNGSGKTAFMRMLATSIRANQYFEANGHSRALYHEDSFGSGGNFRKSFYGLDGCSMIRKVSNHLKDANPNDRGLYELSEDDMSTLSALVGSKHPERSYYEAISYITSINPDKDFIFYKIKNPKLIKWETEVTAKGYKNEELFQFYQGACKKIYERGVPEWRGVYETLEKTWKEIKTKPENEKRVKIVLDDIIFPLHLILTTGENYSSGEFVQRRAINKETRDKVLAYFNSFYQNNDLNRWRFAHPVYDEKHVSIFELDIPIDPNTSRSDDMIHTHFRTDNQVRAKKSPGISLERDFSLFMKEVQLYVEKGLRPDIPLMHVNPFNNGRFVRRFIKNNDLKDSLALVFIDVPTIFLDYLNRKKFRIKLQDMVQKYSGKVQFFIPTNDTELIDGLEGKCRYINLYQTPAESTNRLDLKSLQ